MSLFICKLEESEFDVEEEFPDVVELPSFFILPEEELFLSLCLFPSKVSVILKVSLFSKGLYFKDKE